LSPERDAELAKPAAILSRQAPEANTFDVESMKALKGPDALPM
jgi:hypothetical protein